MDAERLAAIIQGAVDSGYKMRAMDEGFRETAARDHKADAKAEADEYFRTVHGKRAPRAEKDRITREIEAEHEQRHRAELETALGWLDYSHTEELPTLQAFERECQAPETAAERHARLANRGDANTNLILELVEGVSRNSIRDELGAVLPSAVLPLYKQALSANGTNHHRIVRDSVLIEEVERRREWHYDATGPDAAKEHAATLELQRLVAETKAARVPKELREVLDAAREARRYADRLRQTLKLRAATPGELFGDGEVSNRYKAHPSIQRALKRRGDHADH